jgi:hypothetical protein
VNQNRQEYYQTKTPVSTETTGSKSDTVGRSMNDQTQGGIQTMYSAIVAMISWSIFNVHPLFLDDWSRRVDMNRKRSLFN